ncbi:MAG: type II secretion system protein [Candidatus Eremiobacteraeota bacterium]|nr:type II secretion system protein [Candidatus Eremiobacteraeota bacterium]
MKMQRNTKRGLTLVETILASFLLGTMVIAVMGVWPAYYRAVEKSKNRRVAVGLADQQMEIALAEGFLGVRRRAESFDLESERRGTQVTTSFDCLVEVTQDNLYLKTVTVTVSWPEGQDVKEVRYESKISS